MHAGTKKPTKKRDKKGTRQGREGLDRRGSKAQLDLEALSNVKSSLFPPRKGKAGRRRERKSIHGEKKNLCLPACSCLGTAQKSCTYERARFFFHPWAVRQCLLSSKFQKIYKISRHIESLDTCMEY
jgi:hypothetical protein